EQEQLIERANDIGAAFAKRLQALQAAFPALVLEVRQAGAMIALELVQEGDPDKPNTALTQRCIQLAAEHGLILLACGYYGNVLRFLPPLTMPDTIVAEALDKFEVLFRAATEN